MDRIIVQHHIEQIFKLTLERIQEIYKNHKEINGKITNIKDTAHHGRLVFPSKGEHQGNEVRISEQELRFAFVEQFNVYSNNKKNNCNLYYSVETPTRGRYHFPKNKEPKVYDATEESGQSAAFDMVIYDHKMNRVCLIEFKAHNVDPHDYHKDYAKLRNAAEGDENVVRFFVDILKSYNDKTIDSILEKIKGYSLDITDEKKSQKVHFKCFVLEPKNNQKVDISEEFKDIR